MKVSNVRRGLHSWHWKFYTPDNKIHWATKKQTKSLDYSSWNFYETLHIDDVQPGVWKVEFEFDERMVKQTTFEILEP